MIKREDIEKQELRIIAAEVGHCIEISDDFLDRYCGQGIQRLWKESSLDSRELGRLVSSCVKVDETYYSGIFISPKPAEICLDIGEFTVRLSGNPVTDPALADPDGGLVYNWRAKASEDQVKALLFEEPDDWEIEGDFACLSVDLAMIPVDLDRLEKEIKFREEEAAVERLREVIKNQG